MSSKVMLADINLARVRERAGELSLGDEDARSLDANDPMQIGILEEEYGYQNWNKKTCQVCKRISYDIWKICPLIF